MASWAGQLGAAFPSISRLQLPDMSLTGGLTQLPVALISCLAACTQLTTLDLGAAEPTVELYHSAGQLAGWLPHVTTLTCRPAKTGVSLVQGLGPQLHHLVLTSEGSPSRLPPALASCQQLVSLSLAQLNQGVLNALIPLPNLRQLEVEGCEGLVTPGTPVTAQWGVTSLKISSMDVAQVLCLPLAGIEQLTIQVAVFQIQPDQGTTGPAFRAACTALAQVPRLHIGRVHISAVAFSPQLAAQLMPQAPPVLANVGGAFTPFQVTACAGMALPHLGLLAHHLAGSLDLRLDWMGTDETDGDLAFLADLGPLVLRSLHAGIGPSLTALTLGPNLPQLTATQQPALGSCPWHPEPAFWLQLPAALPQLTQLVLRGVSGLCPRSLEALTAVCGQMEAAGRSVELVFAQLPEHERMQQLLAPLCARDGPLVRVSLVQQQ